MENNQVSFDDLINNERPVLVDFAAEWCGPCKAMNPILRKLAEDMGDKVDIVTIDVDQNPGISQHLNIMGVPTFIVYKKGQTLWRQSGMLSGTALTHVLEQAIAYKVEEVQEPAEATN
ncbi:MAG: thioredoxin family protein [Saprospiraceae bacterium]|nr:thioredoxin family protein [Saprospiraceae bacterium]